MQGEIDISYDLKAILPSHVMLLVLVEYHPECNLGDLVHFADPVDGAENDVIEVTIREELTVVLNDVFKCCPYLVLYFIRQF